MNTLLGKVWGRSWSGDARAVAALAFLETPAQGLLAGMLLNGDVDSILRVADSAFSA